MADYFAELFGGVLIPSIQFKSQQREPLINIVVKFSSNPGALLFLGFNQPAPNRRETLLCELPFCDVYAGADIARKGAI